MSISTTRIFLLSLLVAVLVVLGSSSLPQRQTATAATGDNLITGCAWSQHMGWISFSESSGCDTSNTGSDYGVYEDQYGNLSGYAWSSNLGWVSFNESETESCPTAPCKAKVILGTGKIEGWARACAAFADKNVCFGDSNDLDLNSGGWDGWIHLSGTAGDGDYEIIQDRSTCEWSGYAWGSDGIGGISFNSKPGNPIYSVQGNNPSICSGITANLYAISPIYSGEYSTLTWESTGATSCSSYGGFDTNDAIQNMSPGVSVGPLYADTYYKINCKDGLISADSENVMVEVLQPDASISANPARVATAGGSSDISWSANNVESCRVYGPNMVTVEGSADSNKYFDTNSPQTVTIDAQSVFTIDCVGPGGSTISRSVIVNIGASSFEEF